MTKRHTGFGVTGGILLFAVLLLWVSCGKEGRATDMKLARAEGSVGVQDEKEEEISPVENLGLYSGYRIDTKQASYAWINLDNVKLAKMDQNSAVEIRKFQKALELQLNSGSVYFNIAEPLTEEESLEIRTSTMAIGIRGTIGWVRLVDENRMQVHILEGTVQCSVKDPETGETVTAEVSQGETALLIRQPEGDEIRVEERKEEALPEFVQEELREDSQAADRVENASGIIVPPREADTEESRKEESETEESETEESDPEESEASEADTAEAGGNFELLQEYLDNELAPLYGYADLSPRESSYYPDENFLFEVSKTWTGLYGIAEARILDLDGDGEDEMLVVITQGQRIILEVYEIENEVPVRTGEIKESRAEDVGMGDDCLFEKVLSAVETEDGRYLLLTSQLSGFVTGDGYYSYANLYRYDGERLYMPLSIVQSSVGSAEFRYEGFQYDENGTLLNEEIVYDEADYENYDEAYCHSRMEALFGQYGIRLGENATMQDWGIFHNFLAPGTEHEELLELRMKGDYLEDHAVYLFNG